MVEGRGGFGWPKVAKAREGVKQLDFLDFSTPVAFAYAAGGEVARLMSEGKHLTPEGLELIRAIKNKMNTQRKID